MINVEAKAEVFSDTAPLKLNYSMSSSIEVHSESDYFSFKKAFQSLKMLLSQFWLYHFSVLQLMEIAKTKLRAFMTTTKAILTTWGIYVCMSMGLLADCASNTGNVLLTLKMCVVWVLTEYRAEYTASFFALEMLLWCFFCSSESQSLKGWPKYTRFPKGSLNASVDVDGYTWWKNAIHI